MLKRPLACLLSIAATCVVAAPLQPIVTNAIPDRFRPLSFDNQRLAGMLADRMRANNEGFLERVNYRQLTAAYDKTQRAATAENRGEGPGRFLYAAANAYEYRQDGELRKLMDSVAAVLGSAQQSDGYLGVAEEAQRGTANDYRVQRWNLLGLVAYYRVTGEETAYTAAQKLADHLVKLLGSASKRETLLTTDDRALLLAGAGLVQPLLDIYRYTAETDYLDLARGLAKAAVAEPSAALQSTPEMLEFLASLVELYRLTGDDSYLRTAARDRDKLRHATAAYAGVPNAPDMPAISNCLTAAWMRLTLELFRITGQPQYGDDLEGTIYNQVLAGQDGRTGDVSAETAVTGRKGFLGRDAREASACALAEAVGLSSIPQAIWARWANGIAINLYTAGRGTFQLRRRALVQVYVEASYPEHGDILLHVEPSRTAHFPLRLRVPSWAETFAADYGGSHVLGKPGEFLLIDREWKRGDTVKLSVTMRVQTIARNDGRVAIRRGPQLLVLSRTLTAQIKTGDDVTVPLNGGKIKLEAAENRLPRYWSGDQAYQLKGESEGKPVDLTLVPFADALDFVLWLRPSASDVDLSKPSE